MSTFKFDTEFDVRQDTVDRLIELWAQTPKNYKQVNKLQKELRLLDGASDVEAKGYYRQLERWLDNEVISKLEEA